MPTWMAWTPYLLVTVLLVITRLPSIPLGGGREISLRGLLTSPSVTFLWSDIFGTGIAAKSQPLYLPAFVLLVVVLLTYFLHRMRPAAMGRAVSDSCRVLLGAGFVLVFTVPMVRIYIMSGGGGLGLPSMPISLAQGAAENVGQIWPLFAGAIGALGAFIAGSNTISNLMFSAFQHGVAESLRLASPWIVALQAVGAAAGNMIAIHNVVAASATVGLLDQEGATLRKTIWPTLYYLVAIGILGLLITAGYFTIGS